MNRRQMQRASMLIVLAATSLGATTLRRMDLEEMTVAADAVVRVRCVSGESHMLAGEIYTFVRVEIVEAIKGSASGQVALRLPGGHVGHLKSTVDGVPHFRPGEEAVLFVETISGGDFTVTGWTQGTFRIRRDAQTGQEMVTQDTSGLSIFDPATREFRPGGIRRMPLEELRQRVREAAARQKVRRSE